MVKQLLNKLDEQKETESNTLDSKNTFIEKKENNSHLSQRTLVTQYFARNRQTILFC